MIAIYYNRVSGARVGSEMVPAYLVNGYDYIERICQADNMRADVYLNDGVTLVRSVA